MSIETISVIPVAGGWAVEQARAEPLMFLSGGRAEAKADQFGELARAMGVEAEVLIHDRSGRLIGRKVYCSPSAVIAWRDTASAP